MPRIGRKKAVDSPGWVEEAVIYEAFPRVHSGEGTFKRLTEDLDRIRSLGTTVLWLMPIHPPGKKNRKGTLGSPYAVRDYRGIDPAFGTEDDFQELVNAAHTRGMRVIIDWVINHCAWDNETVFAHPDWLEHDAAGEVKPGNPDWTDTAKLNYESDDLRNYLIESMLYWVKTFDIDGFRCDVADLVPTDFWEEARPRLKEVKDDIVMLAESNEPELHLGSFDLTYESEMRKLIKQVMEGEKPASEVQVMYENQLKTFPRGAIRMRFIENHDEDRAIAFFGDLEKVKASAVLVYLLGGVPLLWAGQESGDTNYPNWKGLFDKLEIDWKTSLASELTEFYRNLFRVRSSSPALLYGETDFIESEETSDAVVNYLRELEDETILVSVNLTNTPREFRLGVGEGRGLDLLHGNKINLRQGVSLEPFQARVIRMFGGF